MYIVTMRDEDGTWYLDSALFSKDNAPVTSLSSERRDARTFCTEAYAIKVAKMCEARWRAKEAEQFTPPRGPFKVRPC